MMRVKFFKESGAMGIDNIEKIINEWLKREKPKINRTETNMCSVQESPDGEMYQYVLVSIWYVE